MDAPHPLKQLELLASLQELHGENPFKVRALRTSLEDLERAGLDPATASEADLKAASSDSLTEKILALREGSFPELDNLIESTPAGVIDMMSISGLGPKRLRSLWQEHGIESPKALLKKAQSGELAKLKGFGEKTQEQILQALLFQDAMAGKYLYAEVEETALVWEAKLKKADGAQDVSLAGQVRRCLEVVDELELVVSTEAPGQVAAWLNKQSDLKADPKASGPFSWRGQLREPDLALIVRFANPDRYAPTLLIHSASPEHLSLRDGRQETLLEVATSTDSISEDGLYEKAGLPYCPPELREAGTDKAWRGETPTKLLEVSDMVGILHAHSTYSDGQNTLEEMAKACIEKGYAYLGITDHSKSAFYANGLDEDRIAKQHAEIDKLNEQLAPFRIFKGIESDILADGSLDYQQDVLASFDFIVSSIHSGLQMDKAKATQRLIKAIENPYTTILGHSTGRLLLRREGYPIDPVQVIDAAAANGVCIEINANPRRLDIDWRWVPYALEKGVTLSVNPDAHRIAGIDDVKYGVLVARKGGLDAARCLNSWSVAQVEEFFGKRK